MSTKTNTPDWQPKYKSVVPALMKKFSYKTVMQTLRLTKICLNRGVNGAVTDKKLVDIAIDGTFNITGQKAVATMSKGYPQLKLRATTPIGAKSDTAWCEDVRIPSTGWCPCRFLRTRLQGYQRQPLMVVVTTPSVLPSRSSSRRSRHR